MIDHALVDLVVDYPHWGGVVSVDDGVPETMILDLLRIKALNAHFHADVVSSVMLVTVEQKCKELVPDDATRKRCY
jgi:hypothetical protein